MSDLGNHLSPVFGGLIMQCRKHLETYAVAVCCFCGSAICSVCVVESEGGKLVCSESCAGAARKEMQAFNELLRKNRLGYAFLPVFLILAGVVFLVTPLVQFILNRQASAADWFATVFGGLFILLGAILRRRIVRRS